MWCVRRPRAWLQFQRHHVRVLQGFLQEKCPQKQGNWHHRFLRFEGRQLAALFLYYLAHRLFIIYWGCLVRHSFARLVYFLGECLICYFFTLLLFCFCPISPTLLSTSHYLDLNGVFFINFSLLATLGWQLLFERENRIESISFKLKVLSVNIIILIPLCSVLINA